MEGGKKIFGRDLKNIVTSYHNKLNECRQNQSMGKIALEAEKRNKISRGVSQRGLKR